MHSMTIENQSWARLRLCIVGRSQLPVDYLIIVLLFMLIRDFIIIRFGFSFICINEAKRVFIQKQKPISTHIARQLAAIS